MMTHREALEVLAQHRTDRLVVTTMTAVGIWPEISDTPLDFAYLPSAMGHGIALGLGLALAQPQRGVIVVHGDGCTLMSLGSLVTMAQHPADLTVLIMENGLYEVTGGQTLTGAGLVDFVGLAQSAGVKRTFRFETLSEWESGAADALSGSEPTVIVLKLEGRRGQKTPKPPRPMSEQIQRLTGD